MTWGEPGPRHGSRIQEKVGTPIDAFATGDPASLAKGLEGASVVVTSGAAGAVLLPKSIRQRLPGIKVLIDLNAVPPPGIEGVEATDKGVERDGARAWGALGVGGTKMKIHKAALKALFASNDKVIDAEEALAIGRAATIGRGRRMGCVSGTHPTRP